MIPKIEFRYSWICDQKFKKEWKGEGYPSEEITQNYCQEISKLWKKEGNQILKFISKESGLKWRENIKCYIVGWTFPYSDPLTIGTYKDRQWFIDVLTHELIHQALIQGCKNWKNWQEHLNHNYPKENLNVKIHLIVHAIHYKIYKKIRGIHRLKNEMEIIKSEDYKRAWEIVLKEGADSIIKKFKEITR